MGADIDISKFLHPLDLVSPVEAALHLREARENETTQRMYAQNQMARQSAADFRDERDHREKLAKEEEDRKIAQAVALERAQQMMRSPGGLGPAQALTEAYGGHLNPLTAAVAPPPPPQGDATDQLLASPEGAAAAMSAAGPGPVEGPVAAPGVQSGGMAPVTAADRLGPGGYPLEGPQQLQHAPEGDFLLPTAMHVSPGMQGAMDHQGFVPRGAEPLPPPAGPGAPAGLEALMSRAAPAPAPRHEAPPMPLLYEAVMNGQHYPLGGPGASTLGLGKQYDDRLAAYEAAGIDPQKARMQIIKEADDDVKAQHIADRTAASIGARGDQQDKRDANYKLTAEQQMQRERDREANARTVARIRAAAAGASTPQQQQALAQMIGMKEQGAPDSEIAAFGAQNHVDPKVWNAPVKNVQTEATGATRATERRAGMEFQSTDGSISGTAASPQAAEKLRDKESKFAVVKQRMDDLIADVREHGNRVDLLSPDQIQNRLSMGAAVNAALRPYNGLGGTDASQKLEADITGALGTPGHGYLFGANPKILDRILREAEEKHVRDIKIGLRPGGGAPLPPALTHAKPKTVDPIDAQLDWARSLPGARQ